MDFKKLLEQREAAVNAAREAAKAARAGAQEILDAIEADKRGAATPEEDEKISTFLAEARAKDEEISRLEAKVGEARKALEDEEAAQQRAAEVEKTGTEKRGYDKQAHVGQEKRTYNPDYDKTGAKFLQDVALRFLRDPAAEVRLGRHMAEERVERAEYLQRAGTTGSFSGLVLPQYLTEMYAPKASNLRPFADICNKHTLPENGMTVNIGRVTTETAVGIQAAENDAVTEQDIDDTLLTENVLTAAGQQTLSRQAVERGLGTEGVMLDDLFRRFNTHLDSQLINRATVGLSALGTAITYTSASPTGAEIYPKFLAGASNVEAALLNYGIADYAVMHSRRWHWLSSQLTDKWPMINQPGYDPRNAGANNAVGYDDGVRGRLPNGLRVVVDNNVPTNKGTGTNEDEIYVVSSNELHLWEDPAAPVFIRAEEPKAANLGILYVLYGYFAFSFRRYSGAVQKIAGTGLVAPTF